MKEKSEISSFLLIIMSILITGCFCQLIILENRLKHIIVENYSTVCTQTVTDDDITVLKCVPADYDYIKKEIEEGKSWKF